MITLNTEIREISHPLVKSFRVKQDFQACRKSRKTLVIEAGFDFDREAGPNDKLMDLLADLKTLLSDIEKRNGRFDCVDISPLQKRESGKLAA